MERPKRQSRASTSEEPNPNVFDDEYAVDIPDIELEYRVSDGFATESARAAESSMRGRSHTPTQSSAVRRSIQSVKEAGDRSEQVRNYRSSIAKETRSSFDILHDNNRGLNGLPSTTYSEVQPSSTQIPLRNRPVSTASSFATVDDSRASYRGPSGPSHPYDLFPQAGVPRASIISTSTPSTPRQRPNIYTPSQPAHPYGLYQQNSFPIDETEPELAPAIQVGFPGRGTNFGRQIGPDGEDQGIVGPDGHTEDLPPYSKYPDARTVKVKAPVVAAVPISPVSPVDGASTFNRAVPHSQEELVSPVAPAEASNSIPQNLAPAAAERTIPSHSQSPTRDTQSRSPRSSRYSLKDEKAWRDKSWREKRRTRVCGGRLPVWALIVAISIVLFIIILVGGVIGGLLAVGKSREEPPTVTVTSTQSMFDASFIPAPTGLPTVSAGTYVFPLGIPQEQQKACLTSGDQYSAWSCNVPPMSLWGDVAAPPAGYNIMKLYPAPPPPDAPPPRFNFTYGAQPPKVAPMQRVFWVQDLNEPGRGPALHFQTTYDKLVILEESEFGQGKRKRMAPSYSTPTTVDYIPIGEHKPGETPIPPPPQRGGPGGGRHRNSMLQTGDSPWYCYWNQTFIEGFIYVNQNSTSNNGRTDGSAATTTTSGSSPTINFSGTSAATTAAPTTITNHQARAALSELEIHLKRMAAASPSKDYIIPKNSGPPQKFPFVFKLTERRTPGSGQQAGMAPYCQKMYVPPDGAPYAVHDDDGRPTVVHLNENDPSPQDYSTALRKPEKTGAAASSSPSTNAHKRNVNQFGKRDDPPKGCHCLWVSPVGP